MAAQRHGWIFGTNLALPALCFTLCFATAGCNSDGNGSAAKRKVGAASRHAGVVEDGWTLLKVGAPPMPFLIGRGGFLRIDDATDGKTVVKKTAIAPNTTIMVDPVAGIEVDRERKVAGPLPTGHRYELWFSDK